MSLVQRYESAVLEELLADSLRARSAVAIISGDVGTGKSTLLGSVEKAAADSGAVFLHAVASALETGLPWGVVEQLLRGPHVPEAAAERATRLLNVHDLPLLVRFRGLWTVFRELTEDRPVVIGVDDVHHADGTSLRCLLYLVRRLRSARLLTLLTARHHPHLAGARLLAEFQHEPHSRLIELGPLSPDGVAAMLGRRLDAKSARSLARTFHEATAGNPALVRALVDDYFAGPEPSTPEGVMGDAFGRAVASFLLRHEFPVPEVAGAVAVLGKPLPPKLLGALLGIDEESAARAVATLTSAHLLDGGRFRHGAARAAIAGYLPAGERATLHLRAARLLRAEGVPAAEVAEHIVAGNHGEDAPWAVPVLQEAAVQALTCDDLETGIRFLRAAHQMCGDERRRAAIAAVLADAEWRIDPTMVRRRLPELRLALREDLLDGRYAIAPLTFLLWQGRVPEALRMLDASARGDPRGPDGGRPADADVIPPRLWPSYLYPELSVVEPEPSGVGAPDGSEPAWGGIGQDAAAALVTNLAHGAVTDALVSAERLLERSRLNQRTFVPLGIALGTLTYGAPAARAAAWCDSLLDEAAARRSPTWLAFFTALRALLHLRQGELPAAEERAGAALDLIPAEGWGVVIGIPLSCVILARTFRGRQREAGELLDVAVPEAMFRTPMGQHYLYARAQHHLAAKRFRAALDDFRACGAVPAPPGSGVEPWRAGAAQALIALGDPAGARRLVDEALALANPAHARIRGMTLRVKAATHDPRDRPALLDEAVRLLDGCGDRLELLRALADLADVHHRLGDPDRGRQLARRADVLARQCGLPDLPSVRDGEEDGDALHRLSDAERRVAELAAAGYTNREIAAKLYITVSTVEQHLTKVYRKLNVKRLTLKDAIHTPPDP
ncbi:LuxR C-terminal-related transcriptional regulator [Actinomadura monticuli]|uniref:LuxR C-terminal-related transcriptional regulator n=1 Tax=Actinomadura monticuli TaxID=3097367 RepID=A0ABV4Q6F3_9ACTN